MVKRNSDPHDVVSSARWFIAGREKLVVALLLLMTFALAAGSAAQKSVTVDEYQAVPHGLAILRSGDFHLATGVPVLPSVLPAMPLVAIDARFDTSAMREYTSSWQCGRQFVAENAFQPDRQTGQLVPSGRYHDYFLLGRMVSIAVLLLTCGLCYGYGRSLYGRPSALLALVMACFSPNLLAHGRLVTPDIYLAAAIIGSLWAFDRLLTESRWTNSVALGVCLGAAALCKLTGLLLFILLPLCGVWLWTLDFGKQRTRWRCVMRRAASSQSPQNAAEDAPNRWARPRRLWALMVASLTIGLLVINAGYRFDGTLTPLGQFNFDSQQMRTLVGSLPDWLPVPVPRYFFQGIDSQLAEAGYTAYLMGEFNDTGFYSYYLVGLLVKTPVPVLFLCALAWFRGGRPTRREVPMVATAALLLLFFSISRHKNIGLRYVLFLEPMMAIWIGRLLTDQAGTEQSSADLNPKRKRGINMAFPRFRIGPVIALAGACLVTITLTSWPHYLPYFNWLSGGPDNGHRWLLDSNLDWGQDLILLQRYMEQERIEQIDLAYFGRVPPAAYGIRHRTLRAGETPVNRHVAISANLLWGLMYIVNGDLNYWPDDPDSYRAFRDLRPKAILGHSIYVFDVRLDR